MGWCTKSYPVDENTNNQYLNNNKPNIFHLGGGGVFAKKGRGKKNKHFWESEGIVWNYG
jgi:hypothetical protein